MAIAKTKGLNEMLKITTPIEKQKQKTWHLPYKKHKRFSRKISRNKYRISKVRSNKIKYMLNRDRVLPPRWW